MKVLAYIFGASFLAITAYSPALADAARTMKIGILNDASGPYSDNAGEGSVTAAKMAAEDFMQQQQSTRPERLRGVVS